MAKNTTHSSSLPDIVEPTLQPYAPSQTTKRPEIRIATDSIALTQSLDTVPKYPIVHSPVIPSIYDLHVYPPPTIAGSNLYDAAHGFLALARNGTIKCYPQASHNSLFSAPESASFTETETVTSAKKQSGPSHSDTTSVQEEDDGAHKTGSSSHFVPAASEDGWNVAAWVATQSITHANSHGHTYQREASIALTEYYESSGEFGFSYHDSRTNIGC
ncbi:hypothetical protein BJ912DRAFT_1061077 [Pholiota molesta]|nr:hypothetical protein BJ912DRAFT_1061077 [Pholiota molesta]